MLRVAKTFPIKCLPRKLLYRRKISNSVQEDPVCSNCGNKDEVHSKSTLATWQKLTDRPFSLSTRSERTTPGQ
ncbi:Hypothetical predicted protein [Podarcis lilfordi]|uniref:Uncharacterized protein n=1 Tax=Podarcis lilfordi TaxID=74358 RepID=A0AA35PEJ6_9SAUR|nr:Hypothetical predicted protein [Podarcis lilfordi]